METQLYFLFTFTFGRAAKPTRRTMFRKNTKRAMSINKQIHEVSYCFKTICVWTCFRVTGAVGTVRFYHKQYREEKHNNVQHMQALHSISFRSQVHDLMR